MKAPIVIGPASVVDKPARAYVGLRLQTPFEGMFAVATVALKRLRTWTKTHGVADQGPYFLRYYHCDMKATMEIEVGFVVEKPLPADGDIQPGTLPAGRYATLVYRGNGLRANQAFMLWARDHQVKFDPLEADLNESYVCRYEAYLTDYRVEPRKLLWDVELSIKVDER